MTAKYTHQELGREIEAPAGYYTPGKEVRLPYNGREVLYVLSQMVIDAACCGTADCQSVLVPGYIVEWQSSKREDNTPVTEVEPITDKSERRKISKLIRDTENVTQLEFW